MTTNTEYVKRLMKRCQVGVGGSNALDAAHDIMAECYGALGALVQERDQLVDETERLENRVEFANEIVNRALHLMSSSQVGRWEGVRTFLELETSDYYTKAEREESSNTTKTTKR